MTRPTTWVTGLGLVSALGVGVGPLAEAIRAGTSGVARHDDPGLPAYRAVLPELGHAMRDLHPTLAERAAKACRRADPHLRAGVVAALEAWTDAGLGTEFGGDTGLRVAVVAAGTNLTSAAAESASARYRGREAFISPRLAVALLDTHLLSVVGHVLGTTGPAQQIATASASGNSALIQGCRLLALGEADVCLVLGSAVSPSTLELRALANTGALSWDRLSVPFSAARAGFTPGEAAAAVVLEPERPACSRPSRVHGQVRGWAELTHATAGPEPSASAEAAVMAAAIDDAGLSPDRVDYVNAHATGSVEGDAAEVTALRSVFSTGAGPWVNATKSITGHGLAAAGLVECVATLTQLGLGVLHPTVGLTAPVVPGLRYPPPGTRVATDAVAISNGFGFGGFNTTVVITGAQA